MQPIRTIRIIVVGDHPGIIPAEFGQIPISRLREEVVKVFLIYFNVKLWHRAKFNFNHRGIILTTLVEDL